MRQSVLVFVSHSSDDKESYIEPIVTDLESCYINVWKTKCHHYFKHLDPVLESGRPFLYVMRHRITTIFRQKLLTTLVVTFALICTTSIAAQSASASQLPAESAPGQVAQPSNSNEPPDKVLQQQITLLEAQLQAMRDYHGSLLDTVYWALSGVFVLAGFLVGFGWFANFKVYERDKQALQTELDASLKRGLMEQALEAARALEKLQKQTQEKIDSLSEQLSEEQTAELNIKVAQVEQSMNTAVSDVERRFVRFQVNYLKDKMTNNPSTNMALTDAIDLLKIAQTKAEDHIADTLSFMLKTIDKGGKVTAWEITQLHQIFDALPQQYQTLIEKMRTKLVASDIM